MLDKATIFTKGGVVLWSRTYHTLEGGRDPIDDFIRTVLLEERTGAPDKSFTSGDYTLSWTLHNDLELIFVVVYQKILPLLYIDELLARIKERFCAMYDEALRASKVPQLAGGCDYEHHPFTRQFEKLHSECEVRQQEQKQSKGAMKSFSETSKGKRVSENRRGDEDSPKNKKKKKGKKRRTLQQEGDESEDETDTSSQQQQQPEQEAEGNQEPTDDVSPRDDPDAMIQFNRTKLFSSGGMRKGKKAAPAPKSKAAAAPAPGKKIKQRKWGDDDPDFDEFLKKSNTTSSGNVDQQSSDFKADEKLNLENWDSFFDKSKTSKADSDDEEDEVVKPTGGGWSITSIFSGLTNRVLTRNDLTPALAKLREGLIEKNVAAEITDELCESVCSNLEGKTLSSFKRVRTEVRNTMEEALTRILTPKKNIQLLREIERVRQQEKRPYTIVMIGVNGVGKSTNLAKVCCYLLQQNLKVQIVACDTFRSGAVEQLKVHARNLKVPLFERGYEKDPALVAANGINDAASKGMDVVLIDTAGRMQDNKPLMTALAKLVYVNNPDLILFVGEALVGNEAVNQLKKFNQELEEHAPPTRAANPRLIDGIILTKFDTIDTKVGAAISMVYTTGQPIVFVGTGQNYNDLKTMNVNTVVQALLS